MNEAPQDDQIELPQKEAEPKKRHKCVKALIVSASVLLGLFVLMIVLSIIFSDEFEESSNRRSTADAQALQDNRTATAESWQVTREAISITQEAEIRQAAREAISATQEAEIRQATREAVSATQESERQNRNAQRTAEAKKAPTPSPTRASNSRDRNQSSQPATPKSISHTVTSNNNIVGRKTIQLDSGRYSLSKTTGCIGAELAEYSSDDLVMNLLGPSSTSASIKTGRYILRALGNDCKATLKR